MKQSEALELAREYMPAIADTITVERTHKIGYEYGHMEEFYIWDHSDHGSQILAFSDHSWEHALAQLEPNRILQTVPADTSDIDEAA